MDDSCVKIRMSEKKGKSAGGGRTFITEMESMGKIMSAGKEIEVFKLRLTNHSDWNGSLRTNEMPDVP
jgi:hypothetical protein